MAMTITSTTDTVEEVREALGLPPESDESSSDQTGTGTPANTGGKTDTAGSKPGKSTKPTAGSETPDASGTSDGDGSDSDDQSDASGTAPEAVEGEEDEDDKGESEPEGEEEPGQEPEIQTQTDTQTDTPPKRKGGFQKKIDKLEREKAELTNQVTTLIQRQMDLNRRFTESQISRTATGTQHGTAFGTSGTQPQSQQPTIPELRAEPNLNDPKYATFEAALEDSKLWLKEKFDHDMAVAKQEIQSQFGNFQAQQQQREAAAQAEQIKQAFVGRIAHVKTLAENGKPLYPDYDTVINDPTLMISPVMHRLMVLHDVGPHLGYWFAKNRAQVSQMVNLHPEQQLLMLGPVIAHFEALEQRLKGTSNGNSNGNSTRTNGTAGSTGTTANVGNVTGAKTRRRPPDPLKTGTGRSGSARPNLASDNTSYQDYKMQRLREQGKIQ